MGTQVFVGQLWSCAQGHIDQIDSTVHFETRQMLDTWDKQIQSLCFQVWFSSKTAAKKLGVSKP